MFFRAATGLNDLILNPFLTKRFYKPIVGFHDHESI